MDGGGGWRRGPNGSGSDGRRGTGGAAKMEAAQQKYDIPDRYIDVLSDFFVGYMIEIYKANGQGEELDEAEQMLSTLLKQVLLLAKEPQLRWRASLR